MADLVSGSTSASVGDNLSNQSMPKLLAATKATAHDAVRKSAEAATSANGKNTNYYSTSKDGYPDRAKKGDLFFRTYGDKTTVYQFDGKEWVLLIDESWQDEFEKELQDKLDQAKEENDAALEDLDKQLSDAQNAIDNALAEALKGQDLAKDSQNLANEALDNFKNLSIGGRNLLRNSAFLGKASTGIPDLWIKGGATDSSKMISISDLNQINTGIEITQTALGQSGLRTQKFVENIIGDKSYVQTLWIKNIATEPLNMILQTGERNKETNAVTYTSINQEVPGNSDWIRLSRIFNTKVTTNGVYFYLYTNNKRPHIIYSQLQNLKKELSQQTGHQLQKIPKSRLNNLKMV
ncbi:hypothetical protein ET007_02550 [Lactococcus garvieae]|nr:hypothetical protein [Lactococcus garvieae]